MQKIKEYLLTTIGVALTAIALEYFFKYPHKYR